MFVVLGLCWCSHQGGAQALLRKAGLFVVGNSCAVRVLARSMAPPELSEARSATAFAEQTLLGP